MEKRPPKDVDSTESAYRLRSLAPAVVFGLLAAVAAVSLGGQKWWVAILYGVGAFASIMTVPLLIAERGAVAGASIYSPKGSSTPPLREYSLAESLVARGLYDDAIEAYELLADDHPLDAEPPIRLARLYRDKLQRFDDAETWYKRALSVKNIEEGTEVAATRELIELYTHKLNKPQLALRYLGRLSEKHPDHPAAVWAKLLYAGIKQDMRNAENAENRLLDERDDDAIER